MSKQKTSELLKVFELMKLIIHAVFDMGGDDDDIIALQNRPDRVRAVAAAILGRTLPKIKFTFRPFMRKGDETDINGRDMLRRAAEMPGRPCDEEGARILMDDPTIVPEEYRGKYLVIEGWRHPGSPARVAVLYWNGARLLQHWDWREDGPWPEDALFVRLSESD